MYAEKEFQPPNGPPPSYTNATHQMTGEHNDIDQELLEEAGHVTGAEPEKVAEGEPDDRDLDKNLQWLKQAHPPRHQSYPRLQVPVLIPQTDPGIQNPFSRAWSSFLNGHDIHEEDFLHFIDHLNVCKAASPPFQVLSLAGNVLGFTPIPYAFFVGMGTQALATAGTIATSRVRITRYLKRVNQEYFVPRGLVATIAKQGSLSKITHQPEDALLVTPRDDGAMPHPHGLRDRRLMAMGRYVAPLEFVNMPAVNEEHNFIDKLSSKMVSRKAHKQEEKMIEEHGKEKEKAIEENQKLDHEAQKIISKADREMARKPQKRASIEFKMQEELHKIDKDRRKVDDEFHEKSGDGGKNELKAAKKFLWIAIVNLDQPAQMGPPGT